MHILFECSTIRGHILESVIYIEHCIL